jgi:predicted O-methyltransferase YrrM
MQFKHPDWSTIHRPHWKLILDKHLNLDSPLVMFEVGCFEGRSTVWFADYLKYNSESVMYCIDNWEGGEEVERTGLPFAMEEIYDRFMSNINEHSQRRQIHPIRQGSELALSGFARSRFRDADFIYLDGSHTQRDTLVDLVHALTLLKPGGVIIVDDYLNNMATNNPLLRPRDAVDFVVRSFDNEIEFSLTAERQAVIIRK